MLPVRIVDDPVRGDSGNYQVLVAFIPLSTARNIDRVPALFNYHDFMIREAPPVGGWLSTNEK